MDIGTRITEELAIEKAFTIPLFGGIDVSETIVVMWIIMAVMIIGGFLVTRNLKVENCSKRQIAVEGVYSWLDKLFRDIVGEKGSWMVTYLVVLIVFLVIANLFGIFGFKSPTKDISLTGVLAVFSIIFVQAAGIKAKGVLGWLKTFRSPINVLETFIKPLSLCMRLFGNVLGAFVIMKFIEAVVPVVIPPVLSLYFDLFDGALQAYVFTFLTALYIQEAVE
ncbi:MAG: F0F1 ATP synthase subunit A [Candidatus Ornithomonoglobus sp.]